MIVVAAVRLVTGRTALFECRLMVYLFLGEIGNLAVAAEANVDRIGLRKPRLLAGMGAVAVCAVAGRPRMLHFGFLNQLRFIGMAGDAKRFDVGLRQHYLSVFCRSMADVTLFVGKRRMSKLRHQL